MAIEVTTMGFKSKSKTVVREKISGLWQPTDITSGEYGSVDLEKRQAQRQADLNAAITADWSKTGEAGNPALGNALSQMRKEVSK